MKNNSTRGILKGFRLICKILNPVILNYFWNPDDIKKYIPFSQGEVLVVSKDHILRKSLVTALTLKLGKDIHVKHDHILTKAENKDNRLLLIDISSTDKEQRSISSDNVYPYTPYEIIEMKTPFILLIKDLTLPSGRRKIEGNPSDPSFKNIEAFYEVWEWFKSKVKDKNEYLDDLYNSCFEGCFFEFPEDKKDFFHDINKWPDSSKDIKNRFWKIIGVHAVQLLCSLDRDLPANILIVEDQIKFIYKELDLLNRLFKNTKFWYTYNEEEWGKLLFKEKRNSDLPKLKVSRINSDEPPKILDLASFDLILLDLQLKGENHEVGDLLGKEILSNLTNRLPEVPVFILSWSRDFDDIRDTLHGHADYYLHKLFLFSLPKKYSDLIERYGKLLNLLDYKDRRRLLGNIRKWSLRPGFLWFGDKVYHMIDHSLQHTKNVWRIANNLLYPIVKEESDRNNKKFLYCFCVAIWLHDIGYKGNHIHGAPDKVRECHPAISGEIILKMPKLFNLCANDEEKEAAKSYRDKGFKAGKGNMNILTLVKNNAKKRGIFDFELIALLCMYHKGKVPLRESDLTKCKACPEEYVNSETNKLISLEDILKSGGFEEEAIEEFIVLAGILRLVDALDKNKNRVGLQYEEELHKAVIESDKRYQLRRLDFETKRLAETGLPFVTTQGYINSIEEINMFLKDQLKKDKSQRVDIDEIVKEITSYRNLFFLYIKDHILNDEPPQRKLWSEIEKEQKNFLVNIHKCCNKIFSDYNSIKTYAQFLYYMNGHFLLHSTIDQVNVEIKDSAITIHYFCNKNIETLQNEIVKEWNKPTLCVGEKIMHGVDFEWESCRKYLKDWFESRGIKEFWIFLHTSDCSFEKFQIDECKCKDIKNNKKTSTCEAKIETEKENELREDMKLALPEACRGEICGFKLYKSYEFDGNQ